MRIVDSVYASAISERSAQNSSFPDLLDRETERIGDGDIVMLSPAWLFPDNVNFWIIDFTDQ
jgi:hypothetical protein